MNVKGIQFDKQKIMHDIATLYTNYCLNLEFSNDKPEPSPQKFAGAALEIYCTMLGHLQNYDDETLSILIQKEMS